MATLIRVLGPPDAAAYRELRVRALREHPEAFGRTPEEVATVEVIAEQFRQDVESDEEVMVGRFVVGGVKLPVSLAHLGERWDFLWNAMRSAEYMESER